MKNKEIKRRQSKHLTTHIQMFEGLSAEKRGDGWLLPYDWQAELCEANTKKSHGFLFSIKTNFPVDRPLHPSSSTVESLPLRVKCPNSWGYLSSDRITTCLGAFCFVFTERKKLLCRRDRCKVWQDTFIYPLVPQKIFVKCLLCGSTALVTGGHCRSLGEWIWQNPCFHGAYILKKVT